LATDAGSSASSGAIYFLSDYGTRDEFVGVVHAVLAGAAPGAPVIDLAHRIPAFDVRAGAQTLTRAAPYLGPGVVLAVVDPGVGSPRRGVCLQGEATRGGPAFFVGPDNGLLVAAAELVNGGPVPQAFELARGEGAGQPRLTFDGRDLFAPAAAALWGGAPPEALGAPIDPGSLLRLAPGVVEHGQRPDGRACLRAEVTWVDHFGNVQLAATLDQAGAAGLTLTDGVSVTAVVERDGNDLVPPLGPTDALGPEGAVLRCVGTFADLDHGELGLLADANDHLAVVAGQGSAGHWLDVVAGQLVVLAW
jgi:hypothetical protein